MALHSRVAALTVVAAAVVAAGCGNTPAPQTSSPARSATSTLTVTFSGGYAFVQQEDRTMHVDSVSKSHPLVVWLQSGSVEGQPSSAGKQNWNLDGKRLVLQPDAGGPVELPPVRELQTPSDPTKCTADPPDQSAQANNGFYWPEINSWTGGTVTENPKTITGQVALKGGKLEIHRAGGCFELRNPKGKAVLHRPMVLGNQSVRFSAAVAQGKLTLALEPLEPGSGSQSVTILPDSAGKIDLAIRHSDRPATPPEENSSKPPVKVSDFHMFEELLALGRSNQHTMWMHRTPTPRFPGDECIPIFITKLPPWPPCPDPTCPIIRK